ncbi:MAG: tRNA (cytidine(34)-2'-O)-methyltransferase [Pseudomonadota bacterium]
MPHTSPEIDIVLYEPEIPPNTGNVMRLCANLGARLHLVEPLGFTLDDARMKRAGLDYRDRATVALHRSWTECKANLADRHFYGLSTHGTHRYSDADLTGPVALVFGPETRGLPPTVRAEFPAGQVLRLPMLPESRSLNLSNAVAIVAYEAQRQRGFPGLR